MNAPRTTGLLLACMLQVAACSHAGTPPAPDTSPGIRVGADTRQRLIINNLNMSGAQFYAAYMSREIQQRQLAEMYLAGVLDGSEGRLWCGYSLALPGTVQEVLYLELRQQSEASMQRRASDVIHDILAARLPCTRKASAWAR